MVEDLVEIVRGREGWTFAGDVATFRAGDWSATVRRPAIPTRPSHRWSIAVIHPDGAAAYGTWASSAAEAVRAAERQVRGQAAR